MFFSGLDLNVNRRICDPAMTSVPGIADEAGQTCLRTAHATFAVVHVPTLRRQVQRRAQDQEFLVPRSISVHGLRTAHVSREPATSKPACELRSRSSITWAFDDESPAARWPMPTKCATGASMPSSRNA